jgi:hypothetical protein
MDWEELFPIIMVLLFAFGLPMLISNLRKGKQKKLEELYQHFPGIGVKASLLEKENAQEKVGQKRSWGEKVEGGIEIEGRNIDSIIVVSASSQYGSTYYLNHLVTSPSSTGREDTKKTTMVRKKSPPIWGKVIDIEWRGDPYLAQRLNFDYQLKYKLLQASPTPLKGNISIHPEPKHGYTRIRTDYQLPSSDLFEAIDTIARHVKSGA